MNTIQRAYDPRLVREINPHHNHHTRSQPHATLQNPYLTKLRPEQDSAGPRLSDALGEILNISASAVVIATRRGELTIPLPSIVTAKRVPPPPQRRGHSAVT